MLVWHKPYNCSHNSQINQQFSLSYNRNHHDYCHDQGQREGGQEGDDRPPNCLQNPTCEKFISGEILSGWSVRQAVPNSCLIISNIICACVSCYCKNQCFSLGN